MRVTRFRGEGSLRELVDRLYLIDAGGPSQKAAAASLIEANRHLPLQSHDLGKAVAKGTIIAVPDLDNTRPGRNTTPLHEEAAKAAQASAVAALDQLSAALDAGHERAVAKLKATHELIRSKDFKAAADRDDHIAAQLNEIKTAADAELERIERQRRTDQRILEHAKAASDRLGVILAGGAGGRHGRRKR